METIQERLRAHPVLQSVSDSKPDHEAVAAYVRQSYAIREEAADTIDTLNEEIERLRQDRDRLDFLDSLNQALNASAGTRYGWELVINHNVNRLMFQDMAVDLNDAKARGWPSCRVVIDREMTRIVASRRARSILNKGA